MDAEAEVVGTFNGWEVSQAEANGRFFVKKTVWENGERKEKQIPIKRWKRQLVLARGGDVVRFSAYTHRGQLRFKDHRDGSSSERAHHVAREIARLLALTDYEAKKMLGAN